MHAILRMRFAFRETHSYCYSPQALSDKIYECHTRYSIFWNVVKTPVLVTCSVNRGAEEKVPGWTTRKLVPRATLVRTLNPFPPTLELSTVFQQLSEHLARVREEGNKRQIALSTHLAPKAP